MCLCMLFLTVFFLELGHLPWGWDAFSSSRMCHTVSLKETFTYEDPVLAANSPAENNRCWHMNATPPFRL